MKCYVTGCKSGHEKVKGSKKMYYFCPRNQKTLELWRKAIQRKDHKLEKNDTVCYKHFEDADIIKQKTLLGVDGPILVDLHSWKLVDGAIPKRLLGIFIFFVCCYYL